MVREFEGKVALVTGACGGIGASVVRSLAEHDAVVAAVDRDREGLDALVSELAEKDLRVLAMPADVTSSEAVEAVVSRAEHDAGPIDMLVNTAGVLRPGPALTMPDEDWAATFAVNTHGVMHVSRAVANRMVGRGRGAIVTVASNAASVPRVRMAAYAASKAAATAYTKCLGLELARHGVRCNVVAPGSVETPMLHSLWDGDHGRQGTIEGDPADFRVGIPLGRVAEPGDVAAALLFLLSDRAGHITMHELCVDGGAALGA